MSSGSQDQKIANYTFSGYGQALQAFRQKLGLTQTAFAKKTGLPHRSLTRFEAGSEPVGGMRTLVKLILGGRVIDPPDNWPIAKFLIGFHPEALLAKPPAEHDVDPADLSGQRVTPATPARPKPEEIDDLVAKARAVLEADDDVIAPALTQNIRAFYAVSPKAQEILPPDGKSADPAPGRTRKGYRIECLGCGSSIFLTPDRLKQLVTTDTKPTCPGCGIILDIDYDQLLKDIKRLIDQAGQAQTAA